MANGSLPQVGVQAILKDTEKFLSDSKRVQDAAVKTGQVMAQAAGQTGAAAGQADRLRQSQEQLRRKTEELYGGMTRLGGAMVAMSAPLLALTGGAVMAAARYEELGVAVNATAENTGRSAGEMAALEDALMKTGISASGSREFLLRLMQAEIDLSYATKLARAAQDLAVIGMTNSTETANDLAYAIASLNPRILRKYGIVANIIPTLEAYGKSMGYSGEQLKAFTATADDNIKRQAMLQMVLQESAKFTGVYEAAMGTAAKQIRSMERYAQDLAVEMGDALVPALNWAVTAACGLLTWFSNLDKGTKGVLATAGAVTGAILLLGGTALLVIPQIVKLGEAIVTVGKNIVTLITSGAGLSAMQGALLGVGAALAVVAVAFVLYQQNQQRLADVAKEWNAQNAKAMEELGKLRAQADYASEGFHGLADAYDAWLLEMGTAIRDQERLSDAMGESASMGRQLGDVAQQLSQRQDVGLIRAAWNWIRAGHFATDQQLEQARAIRETASEVQAMRGAMERGAATLARYQLQVDTGAAAIDGLTRSFADEEDWVRKVTQAYGDQVPASAALSLETGNLTGRTMEAVNAMVRLTLESNTLKLAQLDAIMGVAIMGENVGKLADQWANHERISASSLQTTVLGMVELSEKIKEQGTAFPEEELLAYQGQLDTMRQVIMASDMTEAAKANMLGWLNVAENTALEVQRNVELGAKGTAGSIQEAANTSGSAWALAAEQGIEAWVPWTDGQMGRLIGMSADQIDAAAAKAGQSWVMASQLSQAEVAKLKSALDLLAANPYIVDVDFRGEPPGWAQFSSPELRLQTGLELLVDYAARNPIEIGFAVTDSLGHALSPDQLSAQLSMLEGLKNLAAPGGSIVAPIGSPQVPNPYASMTGTVWDLANAFDSVYGSLQSLYKRQTVDPLARNVEHAQAALDELKKAQAEQMKKWLAGGMDMYEAMWRVRQQAEERLPYEERLAQAQAEYAEASERALRIEEQRQQLAYLESQMRLLDLIAEHGLNAADILGGIELGLDASLPDLLDAMSTAMQQIIAQAASSLEAGSPSRVFLRMFRDDVMGAAAQGILAGARAPIAAMQAAMADISGARAPWAGPTFQVPPPTVVVVDRDNRQFNATYNLSRAPSRRSVLSDFMRMRLEG